MIFKDSTTVIPDELIIRHLEGNVVFFCGAGISYDAGLPLFDELILKTREKAGLEFDEEEAKLFDQKSYDTLYQRMERKMGERPEDKTRLSSCSANASAPTSSAYSKTV